MSGAVFLWRELREREEIKEESKDERRKRGSREGRGEREKEEGRAMCASAKNKFK